MLAPMLVPASASAQSNVVVSPFASYVPSAATNPLVGMSLTFGGTTGLALRGGAMLAISNADSLARMQGYNRPWSADADMMFYMGGIGGGATMFGRALTPYVFTGIGMSGSDSGRTSHVVNGWSYGLGAALPLGLDADLYSELRFRMPEYVLPTAKDAPGSKKELRFGLSFHVGSSEPRSRPAPRRRRYNEYDDDEEEVAQRRATEPPPQVVVQQAPPPQVVVVQQPAPPPQQVVVVQQPAPEPRHRGPNININIPIIRVTPSRSSRRDRYVTVTRVERVTPVVEEDVRGKPRQKVRRW